MMTTLIKRGTLVSVVTLIACILGIVAAYYIPIQMIPDLEVRTISIRTSWPGATPQDIEKEILIEQESHLRSIPSLKRLSSSASFGSAAIQLEFPFSVDIQDTLIKVSNALSRMTAYPENAKEPRIYSTSFSANSFMYLRVSPLPDNPRHINMELMQDYVKDHVAFRLETIPGISEVRVYGGAKRQIKILINPGKLAEQGLSLSDVRNTIRKRNQDTPGGRVEFGKHQYLMRTIGRLETLSELENLILRRQGDALTRLGEVADIELSQFKKDRISYTNGQLAIGLSIRREAGANVIDIKRQVLKAIDEINQETLNLAGMRLYVIADDVGYVESSLFNVGKNLIIGALLAGLVMYWFLRSPYSTLIGVMGIPICTVAAFVGLFIAGRTINVISLAGVAFAIGMTLDNTIVVLESIAAARRQGLKKMQAAIAGVRQVWPAVLASTATTVLVFLPILFIIDEAGQLYSDIAIAVSASILASMLVAITLVPSATAHLPSTQITQQLPNWHQYIIGRLDYLVSTQKRRYWTIGLFSILGALIINFLMPAAEYLPEGEEPKAFASMTPPPSYNLETMTRIGKEVQDYFIPYLDHDPKQFAKGETPIPAIAYLNLSIQASRIRIITQAKDPAHIKPLMEAITKKYQTYPGMRAFVTRGSIITSNSGSTRSITLDIAGHSLETIFDVAKTLESRAKEVFDSPRIRARPSGLALTQPMVEIRPRWERLMEVDVNSSELGFIVSSLTSGTYADDFFINNEPIDIYLYGQTDEAIQLDYLNVVPVHTPLGTAVPLGSLANISETVDTNYIRRVDGQRTVTLNIIPPEDIALETGVAQVKNQIIQKLRDAGKIPESVRITLAGASDQLNNTQQSLQANYLIALLIIYLLLVAIFTNWLYPLLIMTSIPLGVIGGIAGLWLFNLIGGFFDIHQSFDMITMLGFLILMGTVVNNPILIVYQAMHNRQDGLTPKQAVLAAVNVRLRTITLSTLTTLCGLAPLVFLPGEGVELYRGVGIILLSGLLGSAIVMVSFLPALTITVFERLERNSRQ